MSQRDLNFSENELQSTADLTAANRVLFLEKVRQSNTACQNGDFNTAVQLYSDALQLDPNNHILYSNRSAARLKQGQFLLALQDATKARELCPTWPKAYYRQGVALQCLGRYGEALATFSYGLAQDPNSKQLLSGLFEASIKSPLRHALDPIFKQLKTMNLESPFVVISVIGQELLGAGQYHSAVTVLESALRIGSCSLKLRGSVFSALSSAYWALNQLDKAISYMQQDLAVAKSLGDTAGECRAHGNLGSAYFSQGSYKEALTAHRYQLVLAMKCKDTQSASIALTSLGHVYTAIGDYQNALASHKQCVQLVKQQGNLLQEAREIGNVGAVYLAMGEFDLAVDCHMQHLRLAKKLNNQVEAARAYSNLGSSHHYKRNFAQAIQYHENVLRIAQQLGDRATEARAYAGLGHASRCAGDFQQAKKWHEKQLEMALAARDKVGEGRACSNLGIVYQLLGEHDHALKLHQAHLTIARQLQDKAGMGRAFGNIGNAYSAAGYYEQAIKYHKQELIISKEVHDRSAEASTHGNLAVAYQALGAYDMALIHYRAHLNIARELKDNSILCALLNLGNCLSSRQEFGEAVQYYEQYLMLSQELGDVVAEAKACHFLGYAHYCIGNYREAVRYYDQDLALAKDLQNKVNMGRAYCNLGLAHLALGNSEASLECQKYFLAIAHMTNNTTGKFRALGNIGDVLIKVGDLEEASKMFHRQLAIARQSRERLLEATACGALGLAHRLMKKFDKALGYHTQELTLRQEMVDLQGECRAHGHLGAVHMAIGNYTHAVKCYQEQLERAQEIQDLGQEAQAFGNLGIARLNMGHYEEAIGFLEQQLGTLEQVNTVTQQNDRARALGHLGDCYDQLGDYEEAIKCHEQQLSLAISLQNFRDQERAYRGLGHSHKQLGNLQEALVCLEKRLVVAHELGSLEAKASAYGDLGNIHCALNNFEQAINCLEHQRDIARELNDRIGTSDAISSLGNVFQQMGDYDGAMRLHRMDMELTQNIGLNNLLARSYGNLASVHESMKNYSESVRCLEKQLSLSNDRLVKSLSCLSLGRVLSRLGETSQAINFLQQALQISQSLNKSEDESRIRYCLGIALLTSGDKETARTQVETAAQMLETVRYEQRSAESRTTLFDLQTSCYHTLQQIYVSLGKEEEALVAAERSRARVTTDYMRNCPSLNGIGGRKLLFTCSEYIFETVDKFKTDIIYYSIAGEELYAWYLQPQNRIAKFHMTKITESILPLPAGQSFVKTGKGDEKIPASSILEQYINYVRDSLGVNSTEDTTSITGNTWRSSSSENLIDDFSSERSGFLRMVNRNHLLNSSNYSLSSLFSLGSISSLQGSTRSIGSLQHGGSTRSRRSNIPSWHGPTSLHVLYDLLLAPFEDLLPKCGSSPRIGRRELILVLENELYLVPFAVLRSADESGEYLSERCSLLTVPSLQALRQRSRHKNRIESIENVNSALVIGGPRIPSSFCESQGWTESNSLATLQEATMVAEMLQPYLHVKPYLQQNATKEVVMSEIITAECVHFASNISWKTPAVVLSPGNMLDSQPNSKRWTDVENDDEGNEISSPSMEIPPMTDFMLSPEDLTATKLSAKLVVLNSSNSVDAITGTAVANFANSWILSGVGAVLVSLWPVPETASKILLRAFYSALLQGSSVSHALAEAMQTVQHTKHFNNPINWAGFMLIGSNIRLSNKVALIGQALCELMKTPDKCRDALRVCLHLVEKSLQRIHRGQKNAMYTTQKSIDNKAGSVSGWKDLLMAVGFRFEPATSSIPSSVFFPQSDPDERLSTASASLQALLALSPTTLHALSKLINNNEVADDIIGVIKNIISQFQAKGSAPTTEGECMDISLSVRLWRINGCHELLASLGFDLMEVGQDQVTLRTGKQANRRNCQFVLQALLALFDTQEAPKSLGIDSASSTESLNETSENDKKSQNQTPRNEDYQRKSSMSNLSTISGNSNYKLFSRPSSLTGRKMAASAKSAFISYVRRRGEPDGGQTDSVAIQPPKLPSVTTSFDNSLNTDSELSDGYTTQQMLAKFTNSSKELCYSGLRGTIKISRPGGGGESDANFTPSPPIQNIDNNVSMALAHQTRIRSLYTNSNEGTLNIPPTGIMNPGNQPNARRPDSSSSASSATDWEGSGHATVLRRSQALPPLPPARQMMPMVDSLRPLAPVYNNLMHQNILGISKTKTSAFLESTSSDSELEKGFDIRTVPVPVQSRNKLKLHQHHGLQHQQHQKVQYQETQTVSVSKLKEHFTFMDRLSVRTENSGNGSKNSALLRKPINPSDAESAIDIPGNNLYFSPAELQNATTNLEESAAASSAIHQQHPHHKPKDIKVNPGTSTGTLSSKKSLLRHLSREMTPTISEVYHERNIGLNIGPPLSKLLLSNDHNNDATQSNESSSPTASNQVLSKMINGTIVESISEIDLSEENEVSSCTSTTAKMLICGGSNNVESDKCHICNNSSCECNETMSGDGNSSNQTSVVTLKSASTKKSNTLSFSKSWLTSNIVKAGDLTTADILEHQNKMKSSVSNLMNAVSGNLIGLGSNSSSTENSLSTVKRACSPFSELLRRDEGDGRSVADSQCSGSFRTDLTLTNMASTSGNTTTATLQSQAIRGNLF